MNILFFKRTSNISLFFIIFTLIPVTNAADFQLDELMRDMEKIEKEFLPTDTIKIKSNQKRNQIKKRTRAANSHSEVADLEGQYFDTLSTKQSAGEKLKKQTKIIKSKKRLKRLR